MEINDFNTVQEIAFTEGACLGDLVFDASNWEAGHRVYEIFNRKAWKTEFVSAAKFMMEMRKAYSDEYEKLSVQS